MNLFESELPVFVYRDLTTRQCLDGSLRMIYFLLRGAKQIPADNWVLRSLVTDAQRDVVDLAWRSGQERASEHTQEKQRAHGQRRDCLKAMRREAKSILRDPDPAVLEKKGPGARRILDLLTKGYPKLTDESQAEMSTSVRHFLEDCKAPDVAKALTETGMIRLVNLLQGAQTRYVNITLQEDGEVTNGTVPAEVIAALGVFGEKLEVSAPALNGGELRTTREIKTSLTNHLRMTFEHMAYLTHKGMEPYGALLAQCREVTTELNSVAKQRETREKNADEKLGTDESGTRGSKGASASAKAVRDQAPAEAPAPLPDLAN